MTALLTEDYREPADCPYSWGDGYTRCTYHDLPVHRCLIQGGHNGSCICMCTDVPPRVSPREQSFSWVGYIDECAATRPRTPGDSNFDTLEFACVPWNPITSHHMCVDVDDRFHTGKKRHEADYHSCRCGVHWQTHASYRRQRDAELPYWVMPYNTDHITMMPAEQFDALASTLDEPDRRD